MKKNEKISNKKFDIFNDKFIVNIENIYGGAPNKSDVNYKDSQIDDTGQWDIAWDSVLDIEYSGESKDKPIDNPN